MICFYHNDNDGKAAAFCVHAWVGIKDDGDARFIAVDYNKPFPLDLVRRHEQVWIVDFSVPPLKMLELLAVTEDVTWIDHHKTAIADYANFSENVRGIRRDGEAGCVLAWKYIHWYTARGDGPEDLTKDCSSETGMAVPKMIALIGDRDVWTFRYGDETRIFHEATQLYDLSPSSDFWWNCFDLEIVVPGPEWPVAAREGKRAARSNAEEFWDALMSKGETVLAFKRQRGTELRKAYAFEAELDGYTVLAMDSTDKNSDALGGAENLEKYDILSAFLWDGRHFSVSLYSDNKVDVSTLAKKRGGGGHRGAAGFVCDALPFTNVKGPSK